MYHFWQSDDRLVSICNKICWNLTVPRDNLAFCFTNFALFMQSLGIKFQSLMIVHFWVHEDVFILISNVFQFDDLLIFQSFGCEFISICIANEEFTVFSPLSTRNLNFETEHLNVLLILWNLLLDVNFPSKLALKSRLWTHHSSVCRVKCVYRYFETTF
jgi:hypothetical protein